MLFSPLTLNSDFAEGAGIAGGTRGEAHVLARVICGHVIQDQCAGAVRVLNDDVMRVCLNGTSIYGKSYHAFSTGHFSKMLNEMTLMIVASLMAYPCTR